MNSNVAVAASRPALQTVSSAWDGMGCLCSEEGSETGSRSPEVADASDSESSTETLAGDTSISPIAR